MPLEIAPILSAAGLHVDSTPPEKIVDVMATVRLIQETVNKFKAANVDSTEYACLKAIVLFKPSKCSARGVASCHFIVHYVVLDTHREGFTRSIFGYRWAAEGFKPWFCLEQKKF